MTTVLLTLRLRRKSDLLRARQRLRHTARLLGLDAIEQLSLTSAVFELLVGRWRAQPRLLLDLVLTESALDVFLRAPGTERAPSGLLVSRALTVRPTMTATDLRWMVRQLDRHTPLDLLEEFQLINNDLLRVLLEMQRPQRRSGPDQPEHAA